MVRRNLPKERIRSLNDFYGQFWSNRASEWERNVRKNGREKGTRRKPKREILKSTWRHLEMKDKVVMSMKGTKSRKWSQFKSLSLSLFVSVSHPFSSISLSLSERIFLSLILLRIKTQIRYHKFYWREEREERERGNTCWRRLSIVPSHQTSHFHSTSRVLLLLPNL